MFRQLILSTQRLRYFINNISYRSFANKEPIIQLQNSFQGQPMLIVGNGPSLNSTPLDDFIGIPAIGMNKIDLLFSRVKWRPTLIVCANSMVARQHWRSFIESKVPVFISWKGRWLVGKRARNSLSYFLSLATEDFSTDLLQGVGAAATVTYTALQFAFYMGANPVILFGVDHSFSFKGKPFEYVKQDKEIDVNHFDPNYFQKGKYWGLPDLEGSEMAYSHVKEAFEKEGRMIYDATIGGKLHVFQKISVEKAKQLCHLAEQK